jgi:TP901 family phage tail tape measure protein
MPTIGELVVRLVADFSDFVDGLNMASTAAGNFLTGMEKSGAALRTVGTIATAAGAAIIAPLAFAAKAAADFEREMRNVNAIAKLSESELAALSKQVLALSREVPQAPTALAKALNLIVQAGFSGQQALDILRASSIAASAGLTSADTATRAITLTMLAYGKNAGSAANVSDILFKTVDKGVVTFAEASRQFGDFVGLGAALGVSLKDLSSAFATLTLTLPPSEAATALRAILNSLIKPSKEMRDLIMSWGVESGQAAIATFGWTGVLERLQLAIGGSTTRIGQLFPNIRAANGVTMLLSENMNNLRNVMQGFSDTTGAATAAFQEQAKAFTFQFELFRNSVTVLAITIGNVLLPVLNMLLQTVIPIIQTMATWASAHPTLTSAIVLLGGALGTLLTVLGSILFVVGNLAVGFQAMTKVAATFGTSLTGLLGIALRFLGIIGLVVTAITLWIDRWDQIKLATRLVAADLATFFQSLATGFTTAIAGVQQFFTNLVASVTSFIPKIMAGLQPLLNVLNFLRGLPGTLLEQSGRLLEQFRTPAAPAAPASPRLGPISERLRATTVNVPLILDGQRIAQATLRFMDGELVSWLNSSPTGA